MTELRFEKIKNNKYVNKLLESNFIIAFVLNLIFLLLVLIFCDLKYEVSDDFVMASILSGAYGDAPNPHMIFVNILIGYLLIPLYVAFPQISWYFIAQIILIFLSSVSITWLLFQKSDKQIAAMLSIMLILFFTEDAYILVQFTKTAMFAVMSGSLLFIDSLFHEFKRKELVWGALLCLLGTLYRFSVIFIAGGFLLFILGYEVIVLVYKEKQKQVLKKRLLTITACGSILIIIACGCELTARYAYLSDENYRFFYVYNAARSDVVDYTDYGYKEYAEELAEIDVSETDYYMMKSWNFADNDVFTLEKMQKTANIIKSYHENLPIRKEDILDRLISRKLTSYPVFLLCIVTLFLGLYFNYDRWWIMLVSLGIGGGLFIYFCLRERYVYRIEFAIFLGIFFCGIYFWNERRLLYNESSKKMFKICYIVILFFLTGNILLYIPDRSYQEVTSENRINYINHTFNESWNYNEQKYRKVVNKGKPQCELLTEINTNESNFYFLDFNTTIQTLYYEWSPWKSLKVNTYDNFIYLAGINSNFPDVVKILSKRELENPLKELVRDNVYVIDNCNVELKLNYLKEHYYPNARAEFVKEIGGYQIWKFYKE